jgi:hypothetical protein
MVAKRKSNATESVAEWAVLEDLPNSARPTRKRSTT